MSFEKDRESIVFCCDDCGDTAAFHSGETFPEAVKAIVADGWMPSKTIGRDWEHFCPTCVPAAQLRLAKRKEDERERERIRAQNSRK